MSAQANIATGLSRISAVLRADAWRRTETSGLTPTQSQILAFLVSRGPARVGEVADAIAVTQPTASDAVAALVRKGHVERRPDPADARAVRLHPTDAGRALAREQADWPDALLRAMDALEPDEEAAFLRGLTRMIGALQAKGAVPVQRLCVSCRHFRPNAHPGADQPHHCAFVDAAFGDAALRLDCGDHVEAEASVQRENWSRFTGAAA